ncbi:hypothetical protein [Nonomuraea jiangxiensis]|uniref:Cell division protein FtsL n=1 Tax=Nonomuraea jiangxiensis TaxID=633440 RepID=A0A1G8HGK2_9ACTN|nr:hypothetical protein [Nonomuraea jiangxiensis]SDI05715.1 hypothetical protein SAMN05421869_104164 [Nonomuraea jiangxiensis]
MTTEQETGRGAPVRRAVPKTGTRRSGASHQSKPRPRPDTRPDAESKWSAAERARLEAGGKRPAGERGRAEADGGQFAAERGQAGVDAKRPVAERGRAGLGGRRSVAERPRTDGKRVANAGDRSRAEAGASRPVPRRLPARRQRAPFVLLVVGLLCGGLVSLLLLNTMLAQDAITDASLREEIAVARQENEQIEQQYQRNTQPGILAELAEKQGQHPDWDKVNGWSSAGDQASRVDTER